MLLVASSGAPGATACLLHLLMHQGRHMSNCVKIDNIGLEVVWLQACGLQMSRQRLMQGQGEHSRCVK